jgi:carbonic anhydrase
MRNAGNIVPPYESPTACGAAATIEYAVEVLEVPDIVVCGHSHCGAVGALARGEDLSGLPDVSGWLEFARPGLTPVLDVPATDPALPRAVQRHVIAQLEALRGYPTVERRLDEGRLRLHGWFYQVDTGAVWELDHARESFALL